MERVEAFLRHSVTFLFECHLLDFELEDTALDNIDLGRKRVDLDAQLRGGLVNQVDRLVGQEPMR